MVFFFVITLEGSFAAVNQRNDDFTLTRHFFFLDYYVITIQNAIFDHTLAFNLQDVGVATPNHKGWDF